MLSSTPRPRDVHEAFPLLMQEVRQRLFRKVRESIEARLFLAKPPFCAALRQLAALVADMSRVRCLAASPGHLYMLEEYADQQVALREQTTKPGLEGLVEKMQQVPRQYLSDLPYTIAYIVGTLYIKMQ